jgi:pheromone shutdown protein TraB
LEQKRTSQRLAVVGTTHVDKSSVERVRRTISETQPSIVALELDEERLWALRDPDRGRLDSPVHSGLLPWLLALLERSVGHLTDVFPGSEMLEAAEEAQRVGARVVMIDKPIATILRELGSMPFLEKVKIGVDVVVALFTIGTRRRSTQLADASLDKLMAEFDAKYPTLSRILVNERDRYMADRLQEILRSTTGQVIAVVGLGHVKGIMQHLASDEQGPSGEPLRITYEWTLGTFPR